MTVTIDRDAILDALTEDGDTFELADGRTLALKFEPDEGTTVEDDGDWYGHIAPVRDGYNDYGTRWPRPDGFDGNAEKIWTRSDAWWWQPPAEVKRADEGFAALRAALVDLLEYGYSGIVLELRDGSDAYGRPIVRNVASLWGIEPFPDASFVREVVDGLLEEVMPD